ncbi:MAG TPA: tRNA adenosine(34) deaminase TadA [Synergistales bacterium]|nr:tRNA adenosine(34) deaminase TadA [Synergistales bacterium]HRU90539.1 tRNA adenosine(34) deaminase TadA [Thermovirgaceae bacterium]
MKGPGPAFMKEHEAFMRIAIEEARKGYYQGEVPVGAILVLDGSVIGRGHNRRDNLQDPTAHAEITALREAAEHLGSWRLEDTTLYSTLEPCPMCAAAAVLSRVGRIVFGAEDLRWGACGTLYDIPRDPRLNHRCEVTGGVLAEECAKMLREFFLALR